MAAACLVLACALLSAASATAAPAPEPAQIYVGIGHSDTVAFKVETGQVSLLGVDALDYCSYTEPMEKLKPGGLNAISTPLLMHEGPSGLTSTETGGGMYGTESTVVHATFRGERLVGDYEYSLSEESFHCQTGTYYFGNAKVPFEAERYVPVGGPSATAPAAGEYPIYFGDEGPVEVFLHSNFHGLVARGSVESQCRFGDGPGGRSPLYTEAAFFKLGEAGGFRGHERLEGKARKGRPVAEKISISGLAGGESVGGTYSRTLVTGPRSTHPSRCETGPLSFTAARYVPAA